MKQYRILITLAVLAAGSAHAQQIYRCPGNAYTNDANEAKAKNCKVMEGGNVTVVEGTKVQGNSAAPRSASAGSNGVRLASAPPRVTTDDQKARDGEARMILESELKKAEARQAELLREYNNGEPEMLGPEHRNRQKYIDRVAELKANIARNDSDIAGIKREIARLGGTPPASR